MAHQTEKNNGASAPINRVLERLSGVEDNGHGYKARCPVPAHGRGRGDPNPSLSVSEGDDGRVLVKCRTGCESKDVLDALGLSWADLYPATARKSVTHQTKYEVRNVRGQLEAVHVRTDYSDGTKQVVWLRPGGKAGLNGIGTADLPLFGSQLLSLSDAGDMPVILCEGEKAAKALQDREMLALGTATGAAGTPSREVLEVLKDREVILWPDNDDEGRVHMERIANALQGIARSVRWMDWPDAPPKGDAADWQGTPDELRAALEAAPEWKPKPDLPDAEISDVCAAYVETKPVEWLWRGRIPKGKLTMYDGDPGVGKSVVTMDIAARVSAGRTFPDGAPCETGNVLIVNVEDAIDDTIVPRLKAHGADLDRVFIFSTVPDGKGGTRLLNLPDDLLLLENKVIQREAVLLIIDPVMTMLGGDANKDQEARKALTPIRDMAERTGAAVVSVRHLNKSVGLKAIQRGGGNMGLIGVARAGSFFAEHPDDDSLRVMAPHKSNLAEKLPSLSYRIITSAVHDTARVEWTGVSSHDANSLAAGPGNPQEKSELDAAKEFLTDELGSGPLWAKQVFRDAREAGVTEKTLYRAKAALRVRSQKHGTEGWIWRLPDNGPEDGQSNANDHVDHVGHVDHVQKTPVGRNVNQAYLWEDGQGGQHGQGGQVEEHGHVPDHVQISADRREILAALRAEGRALTHTSIAALVDKSPDEVGELVEEMVRDGQLHENGNNQYALSLMSPTIRDEDRDTADEGLLDDLPI
jgi:putative DNA primase/helicase